MPISEITSRAFCSLLGLVILSVVGLSIVGCATSLDRNSTPISEEASLRQTAPSEYSRAMLSPAASAAATIGPKAIGCAVLSYIPNRILDLIDIFRFDLGIGVSYGAVVRLTRYGQVGYRGFAPRSFRIGLRGRRSPIFIERYPEYGFGPGFNNTGARLPSKYEIGVGADAILLGAYGGISLDELLDFVGGLVLIDFKRDDLNFR